MQLLYYTLFYGSYISFWLLLYISYKIYKKGFKKSKIYIIYFFVTFVFIYSRFIEPNIINIQTTKIDVGFKANIVVLSDLHLGIYNGKFFLERVIKKVNSIKNADFVIIPGDFTYFVAPDKDNNLEKLLLSFKKIKIPVYVTFGSHDLEYKGAKKTNLIKIFEKYNLKILDNESTKINKLNIELLGLGDNQILDDKVDLIKNYSKEQNLVVIAHNPDTTLKYVDNDIPDITISGHTHGGQIRIPFLYKHIIPCKGNFDQGLYNYNNNKLYVSSGLGEVILPFRLFIPPVIDVIELR